MDAKPTPSTAFPGLAAYHRMHQLLELKARMEQLHADLEYVRLMLRLKARRPQR